MRQRIFKWIWRITASLAALFILLYFALQFPPIQNAIKDKVLDFLSEKYETEFSIGDLRIKFFDEVVAKDILFLDQAGDTLLYADHLKADIGVFSFFNKTLDLDKIETRGLYTHIYALNDSIYNFSFLVNNSSADGKGSPNNAQPWEFNLDRLIMIEPRVAFRDPSIELDVTQDSLDLSFNTFDLAARKLSASGLDMANADLSIKLPETQQDGDTGVFKLPKTGWDITLDDLNINAHRLQIMQSNEDIIINDLLIDAASLAMTDSVWKAEVKLIRGDIPAHFNVQELSGDLVVTDEKITAVAFKLNADENHALAERLVYSFAQQNLSADQLDAHLTHAFLKKLQSLLPPGLKLLEGRSLDINADRLDLSQNSLEGTQLSIRYGDAMRLKSYLKLSNFQPDRTLQVNARIDELRFNPRLVESMFSENIIPDSLEQFSYLNLSGALMGSAESLELRDVSFSLDNAIRGRISGSVNSVNNPDQLSYDIQFDRLSGDIRKFPLAPTPGIAMDSLGQIVASNLKVTGNRRRSRVSGRLDSDIGGLQADVTLNFPGRDSPLSYKGDVTLDSFDLGTFIKNPNLSTLSVTTSIDGSGTDLASAASDLDGTIDAFAFNGYTYKDVKLNASFSESRLKGSLEIDDPNIKARYNGTLQIGDDRSILDFNSEIDTIALQPLNFSSIPIGFHARIKSSITLPMQSGDTGEIIITELGINNKAHHFREDSVHISARKEQDSTFLVMDSPFLELTAKGKYQFLDLPAAFSRMVQYYQPGTDSLVQDVKSESIEISALVRSVEPLNVLMPNTLIQLRHAQLDMNLDFQALQINGQAQLDSVYFASFFSESVNINTSSEGRNITISAEGNQNRFRNIDVPIIRLDNLVNAQEIKSEFMARDRDRIPRLKFGTTIKNIQGAFTVSLRDSLILNQKDWVIDSDNLIRVDSTGFMIKNLVISDDDESISIETLSQGNDVSITFDNFDIGQFPTFLTSEPSDLTGGIVGDLTIRDIGNDPYFLVDIVINDIRYKTSRVGRLLIQAEDDPITDIIAINLSLQGQRNDLKGQGSYDIAGNRMNLDLDIGSFEMKLLDPFLSDIIKDSRGTVAGEAVISGPITTPNINGRLQLNDVTTTIVANNARYSVDNHKVTFDNNSIDIGKLKIYDEQDNVATMTGKIDHDHLTNFQLDLELDSDKFVFLNTTAADNPVFYGRMVLDVNAYIGGSPNLMYVDAVAETLDGTRITISPFAETGRILKEEFVTYGTPSDSEDLSSRYLLQLARRYPFDANILLDATEDAYMTFVVDPIRGDQIQGNGRGNLRMKLAPTGEQQFFGRYYVNSGSYAFSYSDIVSKEFDIQEGGSVTFNGNPLNAQLDIDAIYRVYTSPYELIQNEVSLSESEVSAAKNRTEVDVLLSLAGSLQSPDIQLDIRIPELQSSTLVSTIDRKLNELRNDPNALNNQVFGLLLFENFIPTDNATAGFNNLGNNFALKSISSLISNQLNNLADHLIKGVDVTIDVNSYDSRYINEGAGGNITEVGLQVSKRLFSDRLSVTAGGNINLNESSPTIGQYSSFIGDFVLEYKLTESGQYRVRVFSRTEFDRLLYENAQKTGISLFFKKSFDSKTDGK